MIRTRRLGKPREPRLETVSVAIQGSRGGSGTTIHGRALTFNGRMRLGPMNRGTFNAQLPTLNV
ncbi:MAG TPA: hypothetical protein PLZ39_16325, partial [Verrucomicrobiota bacterium]|nr:hypothetical protein [Verrucomicrobiota bacterium]